LSGTLDGFSVAELRTISNNIKKFLNDFISV